MLLLIIGVIFAALGGDLFVRGSVGIASWARVPSGVVGATVAAFATSSPELSVSVVSAREGEPEIAFGGALGSNIANICLIFAIAMLLMPMRTSKKELKRDLPFAFAAPLLIALLGFDKQISRIDGLILVLIFSTWILLTVLQTLKSRSSAPQVLGDKSIFRAAIEGITGLVLLIAAGFLIVKAAEDIGEILSWNPFLVGATLVALGTSTPELATTIVSRVKGHDDIGVGTVIGSNIFNILLIIAVAAILHPIQVDRTELLIGISFGLVSTLFVIPGKQSLLGRKRGITLLLLYVLYICAILII